MRLVGLSGDDLCVSKLLGHELGDRGNGYLAREYFDRYGTEYGVMLLGRWVQGAADGGSFGAQPAPSRDAPMPRGVDPAAHLERATPVAPAPDGCGVSANDAQHER